MTINNGEQVIDLAKALGAMAKEADMVCVVRCKDCKYHESPESKKGGHYCYWFDSGVKEDSYCSYGERGDADEKQSER